MAAVQREAEVARDLVREAAALAAAMQGHVAVRDKGQGLGPVTDADLAVEERLLAGLARHFPGDAVLSEETHPRLAGPAARLWCVDPIDGTHEYARGLPEYAVQLGLLVDGEPAAGAIAMPGEGLVFWGWRGGPALLERNGAPATEVRLAPLTDPGRATVTYSRRHVGHRLKAALARLGAGGELQAGGVGYKVGLVLQGRAHLYLHTGRGTQWWDTAGPTALCLAAGGSVSDFAGKPLDFHTDQRHAEGLIFAVPGLAAPVLARLTP